MIWESSYWKNDLLKNADKLKKRLLQKRWTEISFVNLEKEIFISFYSIRKLVEAKKISNKLASTNINVISYKNNGKIVTHYNWHRIEECFDLEKPNREKQPLSFICNQLIHSYIFMPGFDDKNLLDSIFFSSDNKRNIRLYRLDIEVVIKLLDDIGNNYPSKSVFKFNKEKQDYDVINYD